ncbi:glutathione S-transferase [Daedaleopsis nitida]|nr:glutathione S-transferase [Daedaleopsis nitida]
MFQRQITLYDHPAEHTSVPVDLQSKPVWFTSKVNPAGKVPALSYGGPKVSPEDPSPKATILTESLVIVEFIAELFPESKLLPTDLVKRANARLFDNIVEGKLVYGFVTFLIKGGSSESLFVALEALQARLPADGFTVGEWSIADVAAAPLIVRAMVLLKNDIGKHSPGEGNKILEELQKPKYARLAKYIKDVTNRPSVQSTYSKVKFADPVGLYMPYFDIEYVLS